jgi:hypothetical protein
VVTLLPSPYRLSSELSAFCSQTLRLLGEGMLTEDGSHSCRVPRRARAAGAFTPSNRPCASRRGSAGGWRAAL